MNLPEQFCNYTRGLLGEENLEALLQALDSESPVSVRLNPKKPFDFSSLHSVPWADGGYYLANRPTFTFDPLFHAGCYYVQEASSMFVSQVLKQYVHEPVRMLDLCAAPGGKSTLARSVLPEGSLLAANEVMRTRSQILAENLIKWGYPDTVVTNNDPADFAPLMHFFDVILVDAPCSGEGMFRKDPVARQEWNVENVNICQKRQRRILSDIWGCLKPGGLLIYSTCTYNTLENEDNVAWLMQEFDAKPLNVDVQSDWHITGNLVNADIPVYRFLPHRTIGEGFFLAVLQKKDDEERVTLPATKLKNKKGVKPQQFLSACKSWIAEPDDYQFEENNMQLSAIPNHWADDIALLRQTLRVLYAGIPLGEVKAKDVQPHHALAMSIARSTDAFPVAEVTYRQAIAYLRREAVALPSDVPLGYVLLTYKGQPLGFEKNIGNRANSLYPQEWRIRSGYLPNEIVSL